MTALPLADAGFVRDRLFTQLKETGHLWLLVDRFNGDPVAEAFGPDSAPLRYQPLVDRVFAEVPDRSPALIELLFSESAHWELLDWSVAQAHAGLNSPPYRPALCGWIKSSATPDSLRASLTGKLRCRLDGIGPAYLRFFDPRVLPRLRQIVGPKQFTSFLFPIECWYQLDRNGRLLSIAGSRQRPAEAPTMHMDAEQSAALLRVANLSRVADTLSEHGLCVSHANNEQIDQALLLAAALGLVEDDDLVAFSSMALREGASFLNHPQLPQWCREVCEAGIAFEDLVMQKRQSADAAAGSSAAP